MTAVATAVLAGHPFLRGLQTAQVERLATTAAEVTFAPGQRIFEAGGHARRFWLIEAGHVILDVRAPGGDTVIIETAGIGDLLGCSWLFPPFSWTFGAIAVSPTLAVEFDAAAVRATCGADPLLGAELTRRVARVMARRLTAARTRLIAVSARPESWPVA